MSLPTAPAATTPFRNIDELNTAHDALIEKLSNLDDPRPLADEMLEFMDRAEAAGRTLYQDSERTAAQSALNYWSAILYRAGVTPRAGDLEEFDMEAGEDLADAAFPYSGLGKVSDPGADQLKGWTRLTRECLVTLRRNFLLAVLGGNGSGRSSLILQGVLPRLRGEGLPEAGPLNILEPLKPGTDPLVALAGACAGLDAAQLRADPAHLARRLSDGAKAVVTVDDFEEIFAVADEAERDAFLAALVALVEAGHFVIIILQSHFIGRLAHDPKLSALASEGSVAVAFETTELRQVIEVPARRIGLFFEDGVIDRLLRDVQGDPAALALLQFALARLWQRRRRNWITLAAYRAVGGGRLALEMAAEETYGLLSVKERPIAEQVFLRLIRPRLAGFFARTVPIEKVRTESADPAACNSVIERFVQASLLKRLPASNTAPESLALAHDSVVTHWLRLSEWVDVKRAEQRNRLLLESVSRQWLAQGKTPAILWRRALVREAQTFDDLSRVERDFIDASARQVRRKDALYFSAIALILALGALSVVMKVRADHAATIAAAHDKSRDALAVAGTLAERGTQLFVEGQASVGSLWLADAFKRTKTALDEMKDAKPSEREERLRDIRGMRVAMAVDQVPFLAARLEQTRMSAAAVSPDGRIGITAGTEGVLLWDVETEKSTRLEAAPAGVRSVAFSPDGRYFATAHTTGVQLWDASTRELLHLHPTTLPATGVLFDGRSAPADESLAKSHHLAAITQSADGKGNAVHVWLLEGDENGWSRTEAMPVNQVSFSPGGERLAIALGETGGVIGLAQVWEFGKAEEPIVEFDRHNGPVRSVDFSPDGSRLLTACGDSEERPGFARVWDAKTRVPLTTPLVHRRGIAMAQFSPTGARVITASQDNTARVWDVASSRLLSTLQHDGGVYEARFSPDGRLAATGARDRLARVWDLASGRLLRPPLRSSSSVKRVQFSDDGRCVISYGRDALRFWEVEPVIPPPPLLETANPVRFAAISADGTRVLTAADGKSMRVWALNLSAEGRATSATSLTSDGLGVKRENSTGDETDVSAVALSGDGTRALAAIRLPGGRTELRTWTIPAGAEKPDITRRKPAVLQDGEVTFAAFATHNSDKVVTIANGDAKSTLVHVIDLQTGTVEKIPAAGPAQFAAFDPTDKRIVTCSGEGENSGGSARVWDAASGKPITAELKHTGAVIYAAFGLDNRLVTASRDDSAKVWDIGSSQELAHLANGHTADLTTAIFNPEGNRVLTTSFDSTAVLWTWRDWRRDAPTTPGNTKRSIALPHAGRVVGAAFAPDLAPNRGLFVTTCVDRLARVWDVETGELVAILPHEGDLRLAAFKPDGSGVFTLAFVGPPPPSATPGEGGEVSERNPGEPLVRIAQARVWSIHRPEHSDALSKIVESLAAEIIDEAGRPRRIAEKDVGALWKDVREEYQRDHRPKTSARDWHVREATVCEAAERWFGAAWHFEHALLLPSDNADADADLHRRCAAAWFQLREWAHAARHGTAILEKNPDDAAALRRRAEALTELAVRAPAQLDLAEQDCWKWAGLKWTADKPKDRPVIKPADAAAPWQQLAQIYADRALAAEQAADPSQPPNWGTTIWSLQQGLERDHTSSALLLRLADAQLRAGLLDDYTKTCSAAVEAASKDDLPFRAWPCALGPNATNAIKQWDRITAALKSAVESKPESWALRNNLGAVLYRMGRLDDAREAFQKSIASWQMEQQWGTRQPDDLGTSSAPESRFSGRPQDWVFLAMINADQALSATTPEKRQGFAAQAVLYRDEVETAMTERPDTSKRRTWNTVELQILREEALERVQKAVDSALSAPAAKGPSVP